MISISPSPAIGSSALRAPAELILHGTGFFLIAEGAFPRALAAGQREEAGTPA